MRSRLVSLLAVLSVAVAACGSPVVSGVGGDTPLRAGVNGSLSAISDKLDSIAMDECATKPAAAVFPDCPRFVAEIANAAVAVQGGAPGKPNAADLEAAATAAGSTTSAFIRDGCIANPGQAVPSAATCGPDLQRIQSALTAMRTALARSTAPTTTAPTATTPATTTPATTSPPPR